MTRIVVLGALGHIGSAVIRSQALIAACDEIVLVDDLSTQRYSSLFDLPATGHYRFIHGDAGALVQTLVDDDVLAVVQLAGASDPSAIAADPQLAINNNLRITRMAVQACGSAGVPLIFPSSTSVYSQSGLGLDEASATAGLHPYAQCKLDEESEVMRAFGQGLRGNIFRFGTIVGPSPGMRFHTAVNRFCWQAATGTPLSVWSSALHQVRPYLAITDAIAAIEHSITRELWTQSIINAASFNVTVADVIAVITRAIPDLAIETVQSAVMNDLSYSVSTQRAMEAGFIFTGSLDTAVSRTLTLLRGLVATQDAAQSPDA
ncbi:MAG: SDR family oxidoreductase [Actinomycetota bacterium]|nr:SDR family oxidoreductase [Actinomycetota bacterium]